MKKIFSILPVMAVVMLLAYACNKKNDVVEPNGAGGQNAFRAVGCPECTSACESGEMQTKEFYGDTVYWEDPELRPGPFQPIYFDFTTGQRSTSGQIEMSNSFNSYLKSDTANCWKVGYLPLSTNIDTISCSSAKSLSSTSGICASGLGFETVACKGWYSYVLGTATSIRPITVFCDSNNNGVWDSNEKGYFASLTVQSFPATPSAPTNVWSKYTIKYKCCPATL